MKQFGEKMTAAPEDFRSRWVEILREGLESGYLIEYDGGYLLAEGDDDNPLSLHR